MKLWSFYTPVGWQADSIDKFPAMVNVALSLTRILDVIIILGDWATVKAADFSSSSSVNI